MIKLANRSEQDVFLDKLLFAYRTVDEESVDEINSNIMKSIQRTILDETARTLCKQHLEYGSVYDNDRYGVKLKARNVILSDISYALATSELYTGIQSIQESVTSDEWDAVLWVTHIILDALEFQSRETGRLPVCSDGRLRSQNEFLDKLVYLSRRGYYASVVTMHDGPKSFQFFNDDLFWSFLHFSSESTGALNVVRQIVFGYEDQLLESSTQSTLEFTRAGLMLKEKQLFILDIFKHLDNPSTYNLLNQKRLESEITESEWHAVFYFVLILLKLFECETTTDRITSNLHKRG